MFLAKRLVRAGGVVGCSAVLGAAGLAACGSEGGQGDEQLPEGMGAIVAALSSVPDDVRCVEIHTSDWRNPVVQANVTPGSSAIIRIAPLSAGYVTLSGQAFEEPCGMFGPDAWMLTQTWEAEPTSAFVQ